jgi:hypothetical protein
MERLGQDSVGESQGAAEQEFVLHSREAAQFCLVGKDRVFICRAWENDFWSGSAQPRPMSAGGDRGRMLTEQCQPDGANRRNHRHAYLPWVQHDQCCGLPARYDGGHARRSLGWCSVHRLGG